MSEQSPPTASPAPVPASRGPRRAIIAGATVVVIAVGGLLAYLIPHQFGGSAAGVASDPKTTGCPSASPPPGWSAATVTVTDVQIGTTVALHVGDTVDFRFPAKQFTWDYVTPADRIAAVQSPAGYYDPARNACIWRLKATATGQSLITFDRRMLCPPHTSRICSDIVITWRYGLTVQ